MAEVITETILPGTYIEVRAEGLLTVGAIATGNVGLLGTAEKGNGRVRVLSSIEQAQSEFGDVGAWDDSTPETNLSLVRAARLLFDNGARTVYAKRVVNEADENLAAATFNLLNDAAATLLTMPASTPGTWGNRIEIQVTDAEGPGRVENELVPLADGAYRLSAEPNFVPDGGGPVIGVVTVRESGQRQRYQLSTGDTEGAVRVEPATGQLTFPTTPPATAEVTVSYQVRRSHLRQVRLSYKRDNEVYLVPSVRYLAQRLNDGREGSRLVRAESPAATGLPATMGAFQAFTGGGNGSANVNHFHDALEMLVERNVQILVVAGPGFSAMRAAVLAHVEKTENQGRERIAFMGVDQDDLDKVIQNADEVADKRVVLVSPGLIETAPATGRENRLPAGYAAAAIAGKVAGLAPHISLTNKSVAGIERLGQEYNYGELTSLVQNRILTLQKKRGIRVVKGISTHDEAFKQITLRRIVDYVKQGTRQGANQYIGKLNNKRVRGNLYTTLDRFLSDSVLKEFLTGFKLTVFADRGMEIRGEVLVTMDLYPTFSIDVIRVVMNLQ